MWRSWTLIEKLTFIGVAIAAMSLLAAIGFGIVELASSGSTKTGPTTPASSGSTPVGSATGTTPDTPPPEPVHLEKLASTSGEPPKRGDVKLGGRDFPESIFYENVQENSSNEEWCKRYSECRGVSYELGGHSRFKATFGITGTGEGTFGGLWWVMVDGRVVKSGEVTVNQTPVPLDLPLDKGSVLELRAATETYSGGVNIVWGNAELAQ
jgi:hypothetical protein